MTQISEWDTGSQLSAVSDPNVRPQERSVGGSNTGQWLLDDAAVPSRCGYAGLLVVEGNNDRVRRVATGDANARAGSLGTFLFGRGGLGVKSDESTAEAD
jgi:hypothetical protein